MLPFAMISSSANRIPRRQRKNKRSKRGGPFVRSHNTCRFFKNLSLVQRLTPPIINFTGRAAIQLLLTDGGAIRTRVYGQRAVAPATCAPNASGEGSVP
ncbi:hypothetical protein EVAR_67159_1 [Eumeta japonica]|uniref:Uncharacterized protein n=1 Tax=Eumeta variegata TaxID=151549 RepID=A0A4C1ZS72_EUMVA|nr:hypothetical protein EVAR_67159_1 [Eumeta japonica]